MRCDKFFFLLNLTTLECIFQFLFTICLSGSQQKPSHACIEFRLWEYLLSPSGQVEAIVMEPLQKEKFSFAELEFFCVCRLQYLFLTLPGYKQFFHIVPFRYRGSNPLLKRKWSGYRKFIVLISYHFVPYKH